MSNDIGLHITIVVLAGPDETAITLEDLSDHIINKSVFIINSFFLELLLVVLNVHLLEDVLEPSVVPLHDSVLGGELKR